VCIYDLDLRGMVIISDVSMFGTMNDEILRIYVARHTPQKEKNGTREDDRHARTK